MSPPNPGYSKSIKESKDNGVFEFEVTGDSSKFQLDSNQKLEIKHAWIEHFWHSQVYVIGGSSIEKDSGHQLILIYNIVKEDRQKATAVYYFIGQRPKHDTLISYYSDRNDTIKLPLYREPAHFLPNGNKRKAYDSIAFWRR